MLDEAGLELTLDNDGRLGQPRLDIAARDAPAGQDVPAAIAVDRRGVLGQRRVHGEMRRQFLPAHPETAAVTSLYGLGDPDDPAHPLPPETPPVRSEHTPVRTQCVRP